VQSWKLVRPLVLYLVKARSYTASKKGVAKDTHLLPDSLESTRSVQIHMPK
jgi:hypothetical protein